MINIIFILSALFLVGCSSVKVYKLEPCAKLSSPNVSLQTPNSVSSIPWKTFDSPADVGGRDWFSLWRHIPDMMREKVRITVRIIPQDKMLKYNYKLMNKEKSNLLEKTLPTQPLTEFEKKRYAEKRVNYSAGYVDYIAGLRCLTTVESSNMALGVDSKNYQTFCNYHDIHKQVRELWIMYSFTHSSTKYDSDTKSSSVTPQIMQLQFKKDMKAIFDSLVIYDMDRERMAKEGLLHDKKYEISK